MGVRAAAVPPSPWGVHQPSGDTPAQSTDLQSPTSYSAPAASQVKSPVRTRSVSGQRYGGLTYYTYTLRVWSLAVLYVSTTMSA